MSMRLPPVNSANATITVRTSERGLPLAVSLDETALKQRPDELADEILALCRLSAVRAQVARRRELVENGVDATVIRNLNLATEEELASAEERVFGGEQALPTTWLRSI